MDCQINGEHLSYARDGQAMPIDRSKRCLFKLARSLFGLVLCVSLSSLDSRSCTLWLDAVDNKIYAFWLVRLLTQRKLRVITLFRFWWLIRIVLLFIIEWKTWTRKWDKLDRHFCRNFTFARWTETLNETFSAKVKWGNQSQFTLWITSSLTCVRFSSFDQQRTRADRALITLTAAIIIFIMMNIGNVGLSFERDVLHVTSRSVRPAQRAPLSLWRFSSCSNRHVFFFRSLSPSFDLIAIDRTFNTCHTLSFLFCRCQFEPPNE